MSTPSVSVVVPTLDRPRMAADCVRGVLGGDLSPDEVVVVDQSAGPETEAAISRLGDKRVRVVRHTPPSASAARNAGAEVAGGEYVAFVDDDAEVPTDWFGRLRRELERLGLPDALYGEVRAPGDFDEAEAIPASLFRAGAARVWERTVHPEAVGYAANFVVRRAALLAVGGFDERLGPGSAFCGAEDMDFTYRLFKSGYRVGTTPAFGIVHRQWREPSELLPLFYGYNLGGSAFCAKHLRAGDRRAAGFLLHQAGGDVRMLASAVRRRSLLRARVAASRAAGTWIGLVRGWRAFSDASPRDRDTYPPDRPGAGG